jgi:uncharacterized protein YidB (DUF937 family)
MDVGRELSALQAALESAEKDGSLSPDGINALESLRSGSFAGPGISTLLQGLSVALSDEAIGTVRGAVDPSMSTLSELATASSRLSAEATGEEPEEITPGDVATEMERRTVRQFREEHPYQAMGAEVSGALPLALANLTPAGWARRGLASALGGGLFGFGQGEGLKERGIGAGIGVAAGGALGLGLPALGAPVKSLLQKTGKAVFEGPVKAGTSTARKLFREAIETSGNSIEEAIKQVTGRAGRMYTLADISPNTQAYLDFAAHIPGKSRQTVIDFLTKRRKGRINRLNSDLEQAFGVEGRYFDEFAALKKARSGRGKELYNAAFYRNGHKVAIPITPTLATLFQRDSMKKAFKEAQRIAREKGVSLPKNIEFTPEGVVSVRRIKGNPGQPDQVIRSNLKNLDAEFLHYLKRGLDDVVFKGKRTGSAGADLLFEQKATRKSFINHLDAYNPAYKKARNIWAGDTQVMDAMEMGRDLFRLKADELAGEVADMTKSELEAFQQGAVQALIERLDNGVAGTNIIRDMQKGRVEKLFRATFPSGEDGQKSFNKYYANLHDELTMMGTERRITAQSMTQPRQETAASIRTTLYGELDEQVRAPLEVLTNMFKREFKDMDAKKMDAFSVEVARLGTEIGPARLRQIAKELTGTNTEEVFRKRAPELLHLIPKLASSVPVVSAVSGIEGQRVRQPTGNLVDMLLAPGS